MLDQFRLWLKPGGTYPALPANGGTPFPRAPCPLFRALLRHKISPSRITLFPFLTNRGAYRMAIQIDAEGIRKIFPEVDQIQDKTLREGVVEIWLELADETAWERFEDIPKNLTLEKHEPLIGHIQGVTRMALALAEVAEKIHGITVDGDLLIAACLLHDISKPLESEPDPGGQPSGGSILPARKTEFGSKIQHGVYGAHKIWEKDLPKAMELAHLVITHTRASNTRAASYEASLIFYADWADSDAGIITGGGRPFAARWIEEK
ncbi:MAG: hypothetical protein CMH76_03345 [Nitrospinae bacterium]|nr:hypothetical protein [Nitrospinota bacterium]